MSANVFENFGKFERLALLCHTSDFVHDSDNVPNTMTRE